MAKRKWRKVGVRLTKAAADFCALPYDVETGELLGQVVSSKLEAGVSDPMRLTVELYVDEINNGNRQTPETDQAQDSRG